MKSVWGIDKPKEHRSLDRDIEADVCIVGGGIAGVWCAYLLSKEGKSVVLIEKDKLGEAATLYTTAFVTQDIDTNLSDLVKMYGGEKARLSWQAGADAINMIESVIRGEKIDCEFMRLPFRTYARERGDMRELWSEFRAARRLGFDVGISEKPMKGPRNVGFLEIRGQAKYHPMKFFYALAEAADKNGVKIFEQTEATEINNLEVLTKSGHTVKAQDIIVATYDPLNNPKPTRFKKGMYQTYVYALEITKGALPEMMFEDTHSPYHYVRVDDLGETMRMVVGGEDHRAELKLDAGRMFRALKGYVDETFPNLEYKIKSKWHGGILEPSDGLPLIGEYAPHEYVAASFSGNGMTYSVIAGKILTDLIMKRGNKYAELYDPRRKLRATPLLYKFRDYAGIWFGSTIKNLFK